MNKTLLNSDTIQTVARYLVKAGTGALALHGFTHASDATVQMFLEELVAAGVGALSLWWSKKQQQTIAITGNTNTFSKVDPTPGLPK